MTFGNEKAALVENILYYKLDELKVLYFLEIYHQRNDMIKALENYYSTFGPDGESQVFTAEEKTAIVKQMSQKKK